MRVRNGLGILCSVGIAFSLIVGMSGCSSSLSSAIDTELETIASISTGTDSLYAIAVGDSEVRVLSVMSAGGYEGVHDPGLDAYNDNVAYGTLLAVAPIAGLTYTDTEIVLDDIEKGSTIYYGVSLGPDPSSGVSASAEYVQVPDLVTYGYTEAQAKIRLEAVGLELGTVTEANSSTVAAGRIISTSPVSGVMVEKGSAVNIVVSAGSTGSTASTAVKLPTLVRGMTEEAIVNALEAAGFTAYHNKNLDAYDDDVAAGLFLTLDPSVNSANLQQGATIGYGLSLGKEPEEEIDTTSMTVTVPNMSGWYYSTARSTLQDYGFYVTEVWEYSTSTDANNVIYTYPEAGSVLNYGDTVTIHISLGPETVWVDYDYYTNGYWSAESAQWALQEMGLNVSIDYSAATYDPNQLYIVYAMSNSGNLTAGSWITLYAYGKYIEPEPVYTESDSDMLIEAEDDMLDEADYDMLIEDETDTSNEAEF